jgi:hypothetical protein
MASELVMAQLAECGQIQIDATDQPGSSIAKSLDGQIGAGQRDISTYGSSIYLINRDPARAIHGGRQLFQRKFSYDEGIGPRVNDQSVGDITQSRALGAGLADSCAACHEQPRGSAGFGGDVVTRPDSRDAPPLFGPGLVEQLADEMTTQLCTIPAELFADTSRKRSGRGRSQSRRLIAKGIYFGKLRLLPDGTLDTSGVIGVDADLRVRPFFHHSGTTSIREFVIGAFNVEMGLQAWDPILCAVTDADNPAAMTSPAGFYFDPTTDNFSRPPACDSTSDPDPDQVTNELDPAVVENMEFYLLNYFKPGRYEITDTVRKRRKLMKTQGCTGCDVANLRVDADRRVADVETVFNPEQGIFNELYASAATRFEVVDDGEVHNGVSYPLLGP